MNQIRLYNKIAAAGTDTLRAAGYELGTEISDPDAILVRSAALHEMEFAPSLKAIARCGAGVNNIPLDRCSEAGIVVFNTPGANAGAVKELTLCALFLAARDITGGIEWEKTLAGTAKIAKAAEAEKARFAGEEIAGKTLGVIGLGAIGGMVANAAATLGMRVIGCDPFLSVDAAWSLSQQVEHAESYEEVYREADYITLHVPATSETKNMIGAQSLAMMKDGVKLINMARGDLVCTEDLLAALKSGKVARYVTDFAADEMVGAAGVIAIPHLGASTEEAEENCARMAARQLDLFLRRGVIRNSVNYPNVELPDFGGTRVLLLHRNIPSMIANISGILGGRGINIENLVNKSRKDFAVTAVDFHAEADTGMLRELEAIPGMLRVLSLGGQ